MRKYFKTEQLIPCYSEEGRCKWCRSPLQVWSPTLHKAIGNAWALADDLLEPTRVRYGKPIRVKRCFMCYNKCKKLGLDEAYMKGEVAEITAVAGMPRRYKKTDPRYKNSEVGGEVSEVTREENLKIGRLIEELGVYDQLVYENCDDQGRPEWLRVSYKADGGNRCQVLSHFKNERIKE